MDSGKASESARVTIQEEKATILAAAKEALHKFTSPGPVVKTGVTKGQYARVADVANAAIVAPRAWRRSTSKAIKAKDNRKRRKARAKMIRIAHMKGVIKK